MSQYAVANKITLKQVVDQARIDCAERKAAGRTMTASYFIEDAGEKYVITVTPASQIMAISEGRRSIQ